MDVSTPQEVASEEQRLEVIRNRITQSESEVLRLQKLAQSETYAVNEAVKAKKWLDGEIEKLQAEVELKRIEVEKELALLDDELSNAKATIEASKNTLTEVDEQSREFSKLVSRKEKDFAEREDLLVSLEKDLNKRESEIDKKAAQLHEREVALDEKTDSIRKLLVELEK